MVADQTVFYRRPIPPFQKYVVSTRLSLSPPNPDVDPLAEAVNAVASNVGANNHNSESQQKTDGKDKWIYYRHTFLQHPDTVETGKKPVVFADIICKSVIKRKNGQTIRPSELLEVSEFYRQIMDK